VPPDDIDAIRAQFPGLHRTVHGRPLIYMDSAATAHKPRAVLDALHTANTRLCANVHRGVHTVSAEATAAHEAARAAAGRFLGAPASEIVLTSGTTEALNLAAASIALRPGDRILLTAAEHHANLVPWQLAAQRTGARVEPIPLTPDNTVDLDAYRALLAGGRVAVVGFSLASNVLGSWVPAAQLSAGARAAGALVVIDAAQAAAHGPIDVTALDADVLAFSGHKVFGPTGIGVLWARRALLDAWPPWQGGGDMITRVSFEETTFRPPPARFEAGTPNITGAIGLHAALDWLEGIGWARIQRREAALRDHLRPRLAAVPGLTLLQSAPDLPLFSFTLDGAHPHDVGTLLDMEGIAVRTGRHCADPLHKALGLAASTRASLSFLNTVQECDALVAALHRIREVLCG